MDLVDEQHVARLQVGQERGKIAGALDHRAGGGAKPHPHLARRDLRERRFAETGGSEKQHVVERLAPAARRLDKNPQIVAQPGLPDKLVEARRAQRRLARIALAALGIDEPCLGLAHRAPRSAISRRPALTSASSAAPAPSRRAAAAITP